MKNFIESIKTSLSINNWHAALVESLCIPDICGFLDTGKKESKKRYVTWFDKYLGEKYSPNMPHHELKFLTASDCYALRCALLHQGRDAIDEQRAKEILDEVVFVSPGASIEGIIRAGHLNRFSKCKIGDRYFREALVLHINIFCRDLCEAAEKWLKEVEGCRPVENRMASMLHIY